MNFCHHLLVEKATCSKVCCDGYDVTNLTSSCSHLKARGFLAARFVKPPVEIKFQLIAPIDIQSIYINRKVGSQISSGFEIYVGKEIDQMRWAGKAVIQETSSNQIDKLVIMFTNEAFTSAKEWQDFTDDHNLKCHHSNCFYLRGGQALSDIQYITIKIFKTSHSSLAAVKFIQIWGKPSRSCNKNALQKLKEIRREITTKSDTINSTSIFHTNEVDYKSINHCDKNLNSDFNFKTKTPIENTIQSVNPHNEEIIPNDFLDSITCEMMQLPMLLPSGQNIDRTTLQRWIKDLSIKGKGPCDPFTGVVFTETNRPIFNTALKIRLDKYMVDFGSKLPPTGRTVGTISSEKQELSIFSTVKSVVANMNTSRHTNNAKVTTTAEVNFKITKCNNSSKDQIKPKNPISESVGTKRKFKNDTITSKFNMKKIGSTSQDASTDDSTKSDNVSGDLQKIRHSLKQAFNSKQPPSLEIQDAGIVNKITLCKSKMVRNVGSSITQHLGIPLILYTIYHIRTYR